MFLYFYRMKNICAYLTITLMLFAGNIASAQIQTVRYLSKSGAKEVAASEAHYFEVEEENEFGGGTRTRFLTEDSSKVSAFTYSDLNGGMYGNGIQDGPGYQWHRNGTLSSETYYKNDRVEGKYKRWYESEQLACRMTYKNGILQDTLVSYYKTGELRRMEIYDNGEMLVGEVYDQTGKKLQFLPMEEMPQFPGGEQILLKWLSRNIKYPKATRRAKAQGIVIMSFIVDKTGNVNEVEVIKGFHPAADAEGLRLINMMPVWKPGIQEGEPVPVRFTVPITFSLN